MNRFLFIALMLCLAAGCSKIDPEQNTDYGFHDDYVYRRNYENLDITPIEDEHYIMFKVDFKDEVFAYLKKKGFEHLDTPYHHPDPIEQEFAIPGILNDLMSMNIKGKGRVDKIPHLVFSNRRYIDTEGDTLNFTNTLSVKFLKEPTGLGDDDYNMYSSLMDYADEFDIIPIHLGERGWVTFACTVESLGNPIEIANWFSEKGGFPSAEPGMNCISWCSEQ